MPIARDNTATLFAEGGASTLRLILYLAAAITVMVIDHRGDYLQSLRTRASMLVEPIYRLAALPASVARATRDAVVSQQQLSNENRELRQQLLLAQTRLNRLDALLAQNARLKDLLDAQQHLGLSVQFARLIDVDLDPFRHRVVLDVGTNQGARVGQPLIDAHGIMGQLVEVLPNTSVAMLITDPTHAIPVVVERTGLRAIAYGSGASDRLELRDVPRSADLRSGDRLLTSGLGGRFPAGFPVGVIGEVSTDSKGLFIAATARPTAALDRSGEVLLLQEQPQPYGPPRESPAAAPAAADPTTDAGEPVADRATEPTTRPPAATPTAAVAAEQP
ncbi:rod shape-determining protein MreC [Dokdonella sp.]|uniref:rod shape-determining protein MreC n=1 Tax=Dokdonella sp. TaxID=2291710 RepID=UPI0025C0EF2A|nr:rod shape-determining protein MreC [Dokdonella sp.]MBX3689493.1 rod shape-determining protein MreC [Dokdonella sp.]